MSVISVTLANTAGKPAMIKRYKSRAIPGNPEVRILANAGRTAGRGALRKPNTRNVSGPDTDIHVGEVDTGSLNTFGIFWYLHVKENIFTCIINIYVFSICISNFKKILKLLIMLIFLKFS